MRRIAKSSDEAMMFIQQVAFEKAYGKIERLLRRMQRRLDEINKMFLRRFSAAAIGTVHSGGSLSLGDFSPHAWQPLSERYMRYKEPAFRTSFFRNTGELKSVLASEDTKTVLGTPSIAFQAGVTNTAVTLRAGQRGLDVTRGDLGAVSRKRIFHFLVNVFPLLQGASDADMIENTGFDDLTKRKFLNRGNSFRNALPPYARWWVHNRVRPELKKVLAS